MEDRSVGHVITLITVCLRLFSFGKWQNWISFASFHLVFILPVEEEEEERKKGNKRQNVHDEIYRTIPSELQIRARVPSWRINSPTEAVAINQQVLESLGEETGTPVSEGILSIGEILRHQNYIWSGYPSRNRVKPLRENNTNYAHFLCAHVLGRPFQYIFFEPLLITCGGITLKVMAQKIGFRRLCKTWWIRWWVSISLSAVPIFELESFLRSSGLLPLSVKHEMHE